MKRTADLRHATNARTARLSTDVYDARPLERESAESMVNLIVGG